MRVSGKDRDTLQEVIALLRGQRLRHRHAVHQLPVELMAAPDRDPIYRRARREDWKRCSKSRRTVNRVEAALVCHPHPQFGGTMHNKVVYRIARGLRRTGCVVLRFNYRGVNLSEGDYATNGETEDARRAWELRGRYPDLPCSLPDFPSGPG